MKAPLVLEVPIVSPQRALHALRVTVKPHDWTRAAIRHRLDVDRSEGAEQRWHPESSVPLAAAAREAARRLRLEVQVQVPPAPGAERLHAVVRFHADAPEALVRAVALVCSAQLPATWFTLGRLALLGGRFWRRERGYRLHLRPVSDIHLPREIRSALRDLLPPR